MIFEMPQLGFQSSPRCVHYLPNLIFHHYHADVPYGQVPNISACSPVFGATIELTPSHALSFLFTNQKILAILSLCPIKVMINALPFETFWATVIIF